MTATLGCRYCRAPLAEDAGEGYAGFCGNCADLVQNHEDHPRKHQRKYIEGCPTCEQGMTWD